MIDEAIVHIGMHKTGSSSIQQTFSKLVADEVEYMQLGPANQSRFMATMLSPEPEKYQEYVQNGTSSEEVFELQKKYKKIFSDALKNSKKKKIIISAEYLSLKRVSVGMLEELKFDLEKYCKKIRVLAYVRSPISYIQSAFQQRMKGGNVARFELSNLFPAYRSMFEKFDAVFGQESVELVLFRPSALYKEDVVQDFARRIGVEIDQGSIVRANESLSREATSILYTSYIYGPKGRYEGFSRDENRRVASLSGIGKDRLSFSYEFVEPILVAHAGDIAWIEQRLGEPVVDQLRSNMLSISSEQDFFPIACDQGARIMELVEQSSDISGDIFGVAELVDRLHQIQANGPMVLAPDQLLNGLDVGFADSPSPSPAEVLRKVGAFARQFDSDIAEKLKSLARVAARKSRNADIGERG